MKVCKKCGRELDTSDFNKCKRAKDSLQSKCRSCERSYKQINKDKIIKRNTEYYLEHKDEMDAKSRKYRDEHTEELIEYEAAKYIRNRSKIKIRVASYRQTSKGREVKKLSDQRRRSYGYEPLNEYFKGSEFHHVHLNDNHAIGIYIPSELHKSVWHSSKTGKGMEEINKLAIDWYVANRLGW